MSVATKNQEYVVNNEHETIVFAQNLAKQLNTGDVLALIGDLGSGKTFLCREIIKSLCGKSVSVNSPTFNLVQTYEANQYYIYHFDLYRLKDSSEVYELGIEDALENNISLIEWPEIIQGILPKETIYINIKVIGHNSRKINIQYQ